MAAQLRAGDSCTIGPFQAYLSDGSVIDLTGASIQASLKLTRGGAAILTKRNTLAGGSDNELLVLTPDPNPDGTPGTPFEFVVYLETADTVGLLDGTTYHLDARVRTAAGKVYTVGEAEFTVLTAYTAVPT